MSNTTLVCLKCSFREKEPLDHEVGQPCPNGCLRVDGSPLLLVSEYTKHRYIRERIPLEDFLSR